MNTSVNAYVRQTEMPHIEAGSTNMNPRNICVTLPCTLSGAPEPSYKRANSGSRMDVNTNISIGFCHTGRVWSWCMAGMQRWWVLMQWCTSICNFASNIFSHLQSHVLILILWPRMWEMRLQKIPKADVCIRILPLKVHSPILIYTLQWKICNLPSATLFKAQSCQRWGLLQNSKTNNYDANPRICS